MNLPSMYKAQESLDKFIAAKHDLDINSVELDRNTILALKVEVAEFCNEWSGFKYWKQSHKINREDALEELADCVHFFLSIGLSRQYTFIEELHPHQWRKCGIGVLFDDVISSAYDCSAVWKKGFEKLICIGLKLGFTIGEMETSYFAKWNKNIERQQNNY